MSIEYLVRQKRNEILRIAERHGAYNVRVFGSVARGEAGPDSDVDFLIEAGEKTSSWFPEVSSSTWRNYLVAAWTWSPRRRFGQSCVSTCFPMLDRCRRSCRLSVDRPRLA